MTAPARDEAELVEAVASIIDPESFGIIPADDGVEYLSGADRARARTRAALAAIRAAGWCCVNRVELAVLRSSAGHVLNWIDDKFADEHAMLAAAPKGDA